MEPSAKGRQLDLSRSVGKPHYSNHRARPTPNLGEAKTTHSNVQPCVHVRMSLSTMASISSIHPHQSVGYCTRIYVIKDPAFMERKDSAPNLIKSGTEKDEILSNSPLPDFWKDLTGLFFDGQSEGSGGCLQSITIHQ